MSKFPSGYNTEAFPTSYEDPAYDQAEAQAAQQVGIPAQWLTNIRIKGEKSNADQVSSAGAVSPWQITPDTRQSILDQTGVDPYSSPQAAAYGCAYLLKQNLGRYGGNAVLATAAYHGGTDQSQWGPKTMAYAKRVTGVSPATASQDPSLKADGQNPYAVRNLPAINDSPGAAVNMTQPSDNQSSDGDPYQVQLPPGIAQSPGAVDNGGGPSPLEQIYNAYKSGQMTPQDKALFEQGVQTGHIVLPAGMDVVVPQQTNPAPPQPQVVPPQLVQAFNDGRMSSEDSAQFQAGLQSGALSLPSGAQLAPPQQSPQTLGGQLERQGGLLARDALQGAGNAVGVVYDPIAATINAAGSLIGHNPNIPRLGEQANAFSNQLGLPTPGNATERTVNAATEGMASAAIFGGAGSLAGEMPGLVGQIGKVFGADVGKQATAMAAGQAAAQHAQDAGLSPTTQAAINLGTTLLTLGGASAAEGLASKASLTVNALAQRLYAAGRGDAQASAAARTGPSLEPQEGATPAQSTQAAQPPAESTAAPQAAAPEASAEQAQMGGMMARMQENQARAAAGGETGMPQGGYVGAQEAAAGAEINPPASAEAQAAATPDAAPVVQQAIPAARAAAAPEAALGPQVVPQPLPADDVRATPASAATANPSASPLGAAAQDFMSPEDLAAQTRKATGVQGTPFGIGRQTAQQTLAAQMTPNSERLAAAERLGIADNLQPDHLTTNQAAIELMQAIKSNPGSIARSEEMQGLQRLGQRGMQVIEDAGGTHDLSDLSAQVKSEMMNTQQQLDQKAEGLYADLRATVPPKMSADASNVLGFIEQRADNLGGTKNLSPVERMIQAKLTPREMPMMVGGQEVDPASLGMKPQTENPSYALLDDVRKNVGAGLKNQGPFKDADQGLLKALYRRLSDDQRASLTNVPGALEKFDTARATVQMRKSMEDDLTSLYGKQLGDSLVGKLGTAMTALQKGDVSKFVSVIKAVPSNMRQQVTASGLAYAFGKATRNGDLNFKSFADWWDGLMKNSQAANAVLANLPAGSRQQLADLATVSRGVANATRESISTGRIMAARDALNARTDGLMNSIYGIARQAAVSRLSSAVTAGAAHVGGPIGAGLGHALMSALSRGKPDVMGAADELIVSPEFLRMTRAETPAAQEQAIKVLANSGKYRRWFDLARAGAGGAADDRDARERWLRSTLASSMAFSN